MQGQLCERNAMVLQNPAGFFALIQSTADCVHKQKSFVVYDVDVQIFAKSNFGITLANSPFNKLSPARSVDESKPQFVRSRACSTAFSSQTHR